MAILWASQRLLVYSSKILSSNNLRPKQRRLTLSSRLTVVRLLLGRFRDLTTECDKEPCCLEQGTQRRGKMFVLKANVFVGFFFLNYESSISSMDNLVTMKKGPKRRKSDDWASRLMVNVQCCLYCRVAVQSCVSHRTAGICGFLVSKVKENM